MSPTTVSRFLNKKLDLPEDSASRIRAAIRALDYQPNATARNLTLGTTRLLAIVVPDIQNPFFSALAGTVEAAAQAEDYSVLLCNTQDDLRRELSYLALLERRIVDGILLLSNHAGDPRIVSTVNRLKHVVVLDEDIPGASVPKVFANNEEGGWEATRHLIDNGHRRIAYVGGPPQLYSAEGRRAGYVRAMTEAALPLDPSIMIRGPYTYEFGHEAFERLRESGATAIFCASDYVAVGVLNGALHANLEVPRDISLVGFDDMFFAEMLRPPLTTVRQPVKSLGETGVRLLLELINGKDREPDPDLLATQLVVRNSVRAVSSLEVSR